MQDHSIIPLGFCQCGCGQRTNIAKQTSPHKGHIKGQPYRFRPNHNRKGLALPSLKERFWSRVEKSPDPDGCWLWTGSLDKEGYGTIGNRNRKVVKTHRLSYEFAYGPTSLCVCHACDERYPAGDITYRRCVRPDHLFAATHADNMADCVRKGRTATGDRSGARTSPKPPEFYRRGERHHCAKLTAQIVTEARKRHSKGDISYVALAREYGVDPSTIRDAIVGYRWQHIP